MDTPEGKRNARGKRSNFICGFQARSFDLEGGCTYIPDRDNWEGELSDEDVRLGSVHCET